MEHIWEMFEDCCPYDCGYDFYTDILEINDFIEHFDTLYCLVYDAYTDTYVTHHGDWIKMKIRDYMYAFY